MADASAVITVVGEQALASDVANGTDARIGYMELGSGQYDPTSSPNLGVARTALGTPFAPRRFVPVTFGQLVESTIQVFGQVETSETFDVGEVGLWLGELDETGAPDAADTHTLLAVLSRPAAQGFLYQKASDAFLQLEAFVQYTGTSEGAFVFPDAAINVLRTASETQSGSVRFANNTEWNAGTSNILVASVARIKNLVQNATEVVRGVVRLANSSEANALTSTTVAISPGRIPKASMTQEGVIEIATAAEVTATSSPSNNKAVTPATLPTASTTVRGMMEVATEAEGRNDNNTSRIMTPHRVADHINNKHASKNEAEQGSNNTKLMTPLRVAEHVIFRIASQSEAEGGSNATKLMTPQRTDQYIDGRRATQAQAEAGTNNDQMMTPQRTEQHFNNKIHTKTSDFAITDPAMVNGGVGDLYLVIEE